jgi:shikimate kinase
MNKEIKVMYKIKAKYLEMVLKYSMKTGINITGAYDKATWNINGFKDMVLEEVKK